MHYIVPVSAVIVGLLIIVYFSYRQTIDAYRRDSYLGSRVHSTVPMSRWPGQSTSELPLCG
jgi:hypothetical protein